MKNKIVLIAGGSASGKTTVANALKELMQDDILLITQDSFYLPEGTVNTNYDTPKAFDFELQNEVLEKLSKGEEADVPIYDFAQHKRVGTKTIQPKPIIIFEGLFAFHNNDLFNMSEMKIFVDTPADKRLARRILRDIKERGREIEDIITRWQRDVQPAYLKHISRKKHVADIIIPWSETKDKALSSVIALFSNILNKQK